MNILVTGGAGFIGSNLCERLVSLGSTVTAADNLLLGKRAHLAALEGRGDFRFVELDVSGPAGVDALFEQGRFDCVFHLAANSDIARSHADPSTDFGHTLGTTWAVLEATRRHSVKEIVFASTSAIYGEMPGCIREDQGPLLPISHYGAAKLASEAFISSYAANYGIRAWMPRFPNVVGPRSTHGAIYDFVGKLRRTPGRLEVLGDGSQVKPYLHVDDLLDAILLAKARMKAAVNVFNVGGDTRCTVRRMAEIVVEESGLDAAIVFTGGDRGWVGDVPKVDYDTTRIRSLDWAPKRDSEQSVRAAARWMFDQAAA